LPLGAGIAIKVGDEVVGAISAGRAAGGDLENACARAGLAARQKSPLIASAAGNEHQQTKASLRCLPRLNGVIGAWIRDGGAVAVSCAIAARSGCRRLAGTDLCGSGRKA